MKRTRNGILIPDVPIMAGGNLPNTVKGVSAGGTDMLVDMGLPSGTKWAKNNIDAQNNGFAASPFSLQQSYFSWGNIQPHNNDSDNNVNYDFTAATYQSTEGASLAQNIPPTSEYDAARAILGAKWRLPTLAEARELFENIDYIDANGDIVTEDLTDKRVIVNDVQGLFIRSRINGNTLFFTCAGRAQGGKVNYNGEYGYYLTSEYVSTELFWDINIGSGPNFRFYNAKRHEGFCIKPVYNDNTD
ncbi:MAG: hypothetical protein IKJ81_09715 [Bacteroidales bacterium]|nr:hypothetical protein [Bacteroidales bacterium]